MKNRISFFFDSKVYSLLALVLISISVIDFVSVRLVAQYPESIAVEAIISTVFLIEYFLRVYSIENRKSYVLGFAGVIDLLSAAPFFIGAFLGFPSDSAVLRVLRIVSIVRVFKAFEANSVMGGVIGRILPYAFLALGLKCLILVLESKEWWAISNQYNIILGVIGFSLAVLLGAKLSTVTSRLYAIEDTICRIVGSMRDMWSITPIQPDLITWSNKAEEFLKLEYKNRKKMANEMRGLTDHLEEQMEASNIGGPNSAGFHRDVAFLIHRATVKTPIAYNNFLLAITIFYIFALLFGIQGVIGVFASFLSTVVLGGVYLLVEDIDDPLGNHGDSLIDARLDAIEYWNQSKSIKNTFDDDDIR